MRAVLLAAVILFRLTITLGHDRNTDAPEACGTHGVCTCTTGRSGIDVDCNELNLTEIPRDLPRNSTIVKLAKNFLEEVPSNSFRGLSKMFKLFLGYNNISKLPADVFVSCPELEILKISYNNIQQMPDQLLTFSRKWIIIDLSHNQLTDLPETFFQNQSVLSQV
ncbi:Slit-like 2 protein [Holothuria leucospilota]|uniref:Slit-like 2 protein n=1 Tax=Holothuria leucospilota TaxID=206669 RepID=A0A9Q1CN80_HOLLE|nr:Slit-like 2 protein [Holothuria leucospilota]